MFSLWTGFLISLTAVLIIAKRNLALALVSGALILGLFTMPVRELVAEILRTVADPSILLLAAAIGVIPIIGGVMTESGQIDSLVQNVHLGKRYLLAFSAALMGLLPMPGGALLSAPILEKGGQGVSDELKAAINNWYRHLFILIYPLSPALVASAKIAHLDVYMAMLFLLPGSLLAGVIGYWFFLRKVDGNRVHREAFSWRGLLVPLSVISCAPLLDFGLKRLFSIGSLATLAGVTVALSLSLLLSNRKANLRRTVRDMKPWNFGLIIVGMFLYMHVFQKSDAGLLVAALPLPPLLLAVIGGFLLGVVTGRVMLPASVIWSIYLASGNNIDPLVFTVIYTAIFFGYIISPVHPCLIVTCEYFRVPIRVMVTRLAPPTLLVLLILLAISLTMVYG